MRALWGALAEGSGALQAAYSLDGVAEELLYVTGPLLAGGIAAAAAPADGLLVSAGLAMAGTALFLRAPAVRRWPALVAAPGPAAPAAGPGRRGPARGARHGRGRAVPERARAGRRRVLPGPARPGGDRVDRGGIVGLQRRRRPRLRRGALAEPRPAPAGVLVSGLVVILVPAALSPGLPALALLAGLAGTLASPALATAYVLAQPGAAWRRATAPGTGSAAATTPAPRPGPRWPGS